MTKVKKKPEMKSLPRNFNILALDSDVNSEVVIELDRKFPKLLRNIDLVAGTLLNIPTVLNIARDEKQLPEKAGLRDLNKRILVCYLEAGLVKTFQNYQGSGTKADLLISDLLKMAEINTVLLHNPSSAALARVLLDQPIVLNILEARVLSIGYQAINSPEDIICQAVLGARYRRISPKLENLSRLLNWLDSYWI